MTDIVKRLRNPIRINTDYGLELDRREAADEIERLRSRLAEAVGLLRRIVQPQPTDDYVALLNEADAWLNPPARSGEDVGRDTLSTRTTVSEYSSEGACYMIADSADAARKFGEEFVKTFPGGSAPAQENDAHG